MTNKELLFAASTVWVVIAAVLVMFMQAGFAFLEAGLTRMKNVGHIAAKNVLIFALAAIVYYVVGLLGYLAKAGRAGGLPIDPDEVVGIAIPVVPARRSALKRT